MVMTYILEIYSFRHQLNIILYHLEFLEIFLEHTFLYHFLSPGRQAVLDHEWKAYRLRTLFRSFSSDALQKSTSSYIQSDLSDDRPLHLAELLGSSGSGMIHQ